MANPGMRLTRAGKNILAQGLLGETIHFTKVAFGDGDFDYETERVLDLTELKSWRMDLPLVGKSQTGDGTVTIVALCSNFELETGFRAKEIGVFATDPVTKTEVLYAYRNAGEEYNFIPARTGAVIKSTRYAYVVEIGDAENVTFDINFSFAYVSQAEFDEHAQSENPHPNIPQYRGEISSATGFWVSNDDTNLYKISVEDVRKLLGTDADRLSRENRQILSAQAAVSFDANLFVIEDFIESSVLDELKIKVTACVKDSDSIAVESSENLSAGETYWLSDGVNLELVQLESVAAEHVTARDTLAFDYDQQATFLLKTTYPGSEQNSVTWKNTNAFTGHAAGIPRAKALNTSLDNAAAFEITGDGFLTTDGDFTLWKLDAAQALLTTSVPIDLTFETDISGFEVGGTEPLGTNRRVIFEVDGELVCFKAGELITYPHAKTFDDVIKYGSTTRELAEISNIPRWAGKKVFPVIALETSDSTVMPAINLKIKVNSDKDIYQREIYSPIYKLKVTGAVGKIVSCGINAPTSGRASCNLWAKLKNNGEWSDWQPLSELVYQYASELQLKAVQNVTALDGSDSAQVSFVKIVYTSDGAKISKTPAEIFTAPQEADIELKECAALVTHDALDDAQISARTVLYGAETLEVPLRKVSTASDGDKFVSKFTCALPDGYSKAALVISAESSSGHAETDLGAATGLPQKFTLEHRAQNLTCTGNYVYDGRELTVQAEAGENILVSYDWQGELPKIYQLVGLWGS